MIQMIIQYEIKQNLLGQYLEAIKRISAMLPEFEAKMFSCRLSGEKNVFIESFFVPTEAHYHAIKKMRLSRGHSVFGILDQYIPGGLDRIGFLAIKQNR
ncbi:MULTISPECIES: hypothetical protein [Mesobacillus]|nr:MULTISPECIES: hypothetical protein [Mesobacillus]MDQ0413956.1 hypothetical protein [Mesobacillus stamsii]